MWIYFGSINSEATNSSNADFLDSPSVFREVKGYEPSLDMEVGFARQLISTKDIGKSEEWSAENIFLWGPAAGNIVVEAELRNIEENSVAITNHNWRVWRLIEALHIGFFGL